MRPTLDEITRNPVCIAVSKSCVLHQRWLYIPLGTSQKEAANICANEAAALLAAERLNGYRRASRPECFEAQPK